MKKLLTALTLGLVLLAAAPAMAQETPKSLVSTYDSLADAILGLKSAEHDLVMAVLDVHYRAADEHFRAGRYNRAAAEMALFANEGDNAVAGVRKRLLDGGHHHHHADDTADSEYDEGFVIVTKAAKAAITAATATMRQATNEAQAREAWRQFEAAATPLMSANG